MFYQLAAAPDPPPHGPCPTLPALLHRTPAGTRLRATRLLVPSRGGVGCNMVAAGVEELIALPAPVAVL